jgi:uncharacterized protein YicC (UPF0701 family)
MRQKSVKRTERLQNNGLPKEQQSGKENTIEQPTKPLFSQKEIRAIVKDFAVAYISGQIKIQFVCADERMEIARKTGEKFDYTQALRYELDMKTTFRDKVAVCIGAKKSTAKELEETINGLFNDIVTFRNGGRIEGVFIEYSSESRIRELEEGLEKVNNLVEEIVEWIYKGVSER